MPEEQDSKKHEPNEVDFDEAAEGAEDAASSDEPTIDTDQTFHIDDPLTDLQAKCDELEQKLLRTTADYQNYVRRSQQNIIAARDEAKMSMTKSLLAVLDHLDHAVSVDPESTPAKSVLEGVRIVQDEFMRTLGAAGIERIDAQPGDEFDPNLHEALMRQPSEDYESNHVVMALQPGYKLGDKTLRPAKVAIAE